MEGVVVFIAAGISYWIGERVSDYLLILYYHRNFLSEDSFMRLYDFSDGELHYKFFSDKEGKELKKYVEYLRQHQEARPEAYRTYIKHMKALTKHLLLLLLITLVVPTVIFFGYTAIYPSVYLVVLLGWIIYKRFVKQNNIGFYVMLMINVIINAETDSVK